MEDHLQQKVPELLSQILTVSSLSGLCDLIGFFEGIRHQTLEVLLKVPGAAPFGVPELGHDVEKAINRL
jgi:hypothetical protein